MKFTSKSERAPYSRSKHGSFNVEEINVEGPLKRKPWRRCCCCTLVAFLVLVLVLFIVGLTLYLVFKPRYPSVEMSNIKVANIKVTPKRDGLKSNALLTLNMTANLTAINPNRFRITYSPTEADVSYKDLYLGNSTVPAIDQPGQSNYTISVLLLTDSINIFKGTGLSLLMDSANGAIPFTVVGTIRARIHFLGITSSILTWLREANRIHKLEMIVSTASEDFIENGASHPCSFTCSACLRRFKVPFECHFQQPKGCKKAEVQFATELQTMIIGGVGRLTTWVFDHQNFGL